MPSTPQAELVGTWEASNGERYTVEIDPMHDGNTVYGLFVKTAGNLTLCWSPMLPGTAVLVDSAGTMQLDVGGPAPKCSGGKRSMRGHLVWDPSGKLGGGGARQPRQCSAAACSNHHVEGRHQARLEGMVQSPLNNRRKAVLHELPVHCWYAGTPERRDNSIDQIKLKFKYFSS